MKTLMEVLMERELCLRELSRPDVRHKWARAFLQGAAAALDWVADSKLRGTQRPSSITSEDPTPEDT